MMSFVCVLKEGCGAHRDKDPDTGENVDVELGVPFTSAIDWPTRSPGKFRRGDGNKTAAKTPAKKDKPAKDPEQPRNVTDSFPAAGEGGLIVMKQGAECTVYDADAPNEPLNDEPLRGNGAVKKFLKKYLG